MSIVSQYASPEAKAALARQRRWATVSSLLLAIVAVVLVLLVLAFVLLPSLRVEHTPIVSYSAIREKEEAVDQREVTPQVQRQPSAPSASMARVVASNSSSPTAVPVPDVESVDPSLDFGYGDDFGAGWGSGDGLGSGGATFFGQTTRAERVAFVIDFSASMKKDGRDDLMRKELQKSLAGLMPETKFQMIFFAGPAWVADDKLTSGRKTAEVKGDRGHTFKWACGGSAHDWKQVGKRQQPSWLEATDGQISKAKKSVRETGLVWGTVWGPPLEMALSMEPAPQVIYFMTDGAAGNKSAETAKSIGNRAKGLGITINCIAMMEPRAHDAMKDLAKRTNGQFTKVMKGGKVIKVR